MIPKFLKCQRVYEPTPLGSLQKLSVRLERPSLDLLSPTNDALDLSRVFLSGNFGAYTCNSRYNVDSLAAPRNYIFIQTSTYFLFSAFGDNDRIYLQNVTGVTVTVPPTLPGPAAQEFATFLNRPSGHVVVGIASLDGTTITDGPNVQGYANYIIIRSQFEDPTTGSVIRNFFDTALNEGTLATTLDSVAQTGARIINANRQVHMVFRIITREMDSASNIRPDNVM
jgi:hypothetical protein